MLIVKKSLLCVKDFNPDLGGHSLASTDKVTIVVHSTDHSTDLPYTFPKRSVRSTVEGYRGEPNINRASGGNAFNKPFIQAG